ncbi:hypothetical protein Tco_0628646 [Tanacetum coccineum]|uniref:Ovate family protein n=1 Tax=Tanacetum coccineum TaxID=301880 RepID=A0ABQ4WQW9_9ASTR
MEKTRNKPKKLLPYGMLLTKLFKHVMSVSHDAIGSWQERPRDSNDSSSSTTLNHPSSSRPLDDNIDENDKELFHSKSSSPSQNVSSSSNDISKVRQNPTHESQYLNTYLSETINLQTQQRDDHRKGYGHFHDIATKGFIDLANKDADITKELKQAWWYRVDSDTLTREDAELRFFDCFLQASNLGGIE